MKIIKVNKTDILPELTQKSDILTKLNDKTAVKNGNLS